MAIGGGLFSHPGVIEHHLGLFPVKNLEYLLFVGFSVLQHFLTGKGFAGLALAGRIANHGGKIADQKMHLMAQVLKLLKLLDKHRMPQMKIGCCWIKPGLDPQRHAAGNRFLELFFKLDRNQYLDGSAPDDGHLFLHRFHNHNFAHHFNLFIVVDPLDDAFAKTYRMDKVNFRPTRPGIFSDMKAYI